MDRVRGYEGLTIDFRDWPFPLKCNPFYLQLRKPANDWFLSFGFFSEPDADQSFVDADVPWLASVTLPSAKPARLRDACDLMALTIYRDDEFDAASGSERQAMITEAIEVLEASTTSTSKWAMAYQDVWSRITHKAAPQQISRLHDAFQDYLAACQEMTRWQEQRSHSSIDTYLATRRNSIGARIDCFLVEYALDLELTTAQLDSPLLRQITRAHLDCTIAIQDLLSYKKEILEGTSENMIEVFRKAKACSVQDAIFETHRFLRSQVEIYETCAAQLFRQNSTTQSLEEYINGLRDFASGIIAWTNYSTRYSSNDILLEAMTVA